MGISNVFVQLHSELANVFVLQLDGVGVDFIIIIIIIIIGLFS